MRRRSPLRTLLRRHEFEQIDARLAGAVGLALIERDGEERRSGSRPRPRQAQVCPIVRERAQRPKQPPRGITPVPRGQRAQRIPGREMRLGQGAEVGFAGDELRDQFAPRGTAWAVGAEPLLAFFRHLV